MTNDRTSYWDKMSYFQLLCICQVADKQKDNHCQNPEQCLSEAPAENAYHEVTKPDRDRRNDYP